MQTDLTYIDAHAHLNFDQFDGDRSEIIAKMPAAGIGAINIGVDAATSRASLELAREYEHIWAAVGCHPTEVKDDFALDPYQKLISEHKDQVVAVGECGLDYSRASYRGEEETARQHAAFEEQIQLAIQADLPLVLHLRPREGSLDAYADGLELLEYYSNQYGDKLRGTAHFFVGDSATARRFLDIGFYISATGVVTFDNDLQRVFADLPTDRLLAETDAPFAAPAPHRGKRNSPLYLPDIVSGLASVVGQEESELASQLVANTTRLFSR